MYSRRLVLVLLTTDTFSFLHSYIMQQKRTGLIIILIILFIVCAVSAPSEGIAFNGQKNNESNIVCNFDGRQQNVAKVSFPSVYNVVVQNSSNCAKPRITFFYDKIIKQYQNNKSNSCSITERVPLGKNKKKDSKVDFVYRKRNLLWDMNETKYNFRTLRPPVSQKTGCIALGTRGPNRCPKEQQRMKPIEKIKALWKNFRKDGDLEMKKEKEKKPKKPKKPEANIRFGLNSNERKMLFCLKNLKTKNKKKAFHNLHLDAVKVDDELDLNKRIEKLVEQLAAENHQKKDEEGLGSGMRARESSSTVFLKGENKLLPVFNNYRKMFRLSKNYLNNRILGVNIVPVRNLRGRDAVSERGENPVSSSDILKTMRKRALLRRNSHKSHNSYRYNRNEEQRHRKKLIEQSNSHSAGFKTNTFLYHRNSRNAKKRWLRRRMRRNRSRYGPRDWPFTNNYETFPALAETLDCDDNSQDENTTLTAMTDPTTSTTTPAATTAITSTTTPEPCDQSESNTKPPKVFSMNGGSLNFILQGWKDIDEVLKSTTPEEITQDEKEEEKDKKGGDDRKEAVDKKEEEDNKEEEKIEREDFTETTDDTPVTEGFLIPSFPLEKPVEKESRKESDTGIQNPASKHQEETDGNVPECNTHATSRKHFNALPFLKIRHLLKDYIMHKKNQEAKKMIHFCRRKKRFGTKNQPGRKNWRSAPLLCIPYIRKGQEDQLKFLIKVMQHMMGKPFPSKSDIFEKAKPKTRGGEGGATPKNFHSDEDEPNDSMGIEYQYNLPQRNSNLYHQSSPRHSPGDSNAAYQPSGSKSDALSGSSSAPVSPDLTGDSHLSQNPNPKSLSPSAQVCLHLTEGKKGSPANHYSPNEKFASSESYYRPITSAPETTTPSHLHTSSLKSTPPPDCPAPPSTSTSTSAPTSTATSSAPAASAPAPDISSPSPILEPSTAAAPVQGIHPSTVNSVLQESKRENEGASSDKSSVQLSLKKEKIAEQEPAAKHDFEACNVNVSALSPIDRFKFSSSYYRAPALADYKDLEMYNSVYPSHVSWSRNKVKRREFESGQKFFDKDDEEASYYGKPSHLYKGRNLKSHFKGDHRGDFWLRFLNGRYHLPLQIPGIQPPKAVCNMEILKTKYPPVNNYNVRKMEYWPQYSRKQTVKESALDSKKMPQLFDSHPQPKFENTHFRPTHKGQRPWSYEFGVNELNPSSERVKNYQRGRYATTLSSAKVYDMGEHNFLKRYKRGDEYYLGPDNDYSDYFYDNNYIDDDSRSQASLKNSNPDSNWTPPSYDMFSELAKAVAQTEEPVSEESTDSFAVKGNLVTAANKPTSTLDYDKEQFVEGFTDSPIQATERDIYSEEPLIPSGKGRGKNKETKKQTFDCVMKHPKHLVDSNEDKEMVEDYAIASDNGRGPTTLKSASIVKGQKKVLTKPSPKVYTKVFPDTFEREDGQKEELTTTSVKTTEALNIVKPTEQPLSPKSDFRLQVLAVCEGYLEVVKLIKAQNQTLGDDVDENLARYCENIISQNFNFQSEKPRKSELIEALVQPTNKRDSEKVTDANDASAYRAEPFSVSRFPWEMSSDNLVADRELEEIIRSESLKYPSQFKKKKKRRKARLSCRHLPKLRKEVRRKKETEDEVKKKCMSKDQVQLIRLLKKRKKALLSWLLTSKDGVKPDVLKETEYLDDEELIDQEADISQYSGTIKPKIDEKNSGTAKKSLSSPNATIFPVYAKDYGYDSGGELIEVEVLWRQVNDKTHENKIFKNVSVLALLLTSTNSPKVKHEETKLVGDESEDATDPKYRNKNKLAIDAAKLEAEYDNSSTTSTALEDKSEVPTSTSNSVIKRIVKASGKSNRKNNTQIIMSKPDPTSIVGAPTNVNKTHRKTSHKYGVAKDLFQEYSIEFLNYAVYILPMMFTILFLLCCLCCALQILNTQKSHKKRKKKKKKAESTEESSNSCSSGTEKKRKREAKRKRIAESKDSYENTHKKKNKTFWNYLKVGGKPGSEQEEENDQTEKRKNFLGFLKGKREEFKREYSSAPTQETDEDLHEYTGNRERKHYSDQYLTSRERRREEEKRKNEGQSEAAERRELIALLEELKKIETEHIEGKKEVKSVQVQYMTPEYDNPVLQSTPQIPDFSFPYEKNVFGMPKGICPFPSKKFQFQPAVPPATGDYNLYEDVNELTELLPWGCYSHRNDLLKNCDIKINQRARYDRFLKIFRDSGMNCNNPVIEKNCKKDESENRSFIFNKYRSISTDRSGELMGVTPKIAGTEVGLTENAPPYKIFSEKDEDLVEDSENLKSQLNKKKKVGLKDEGVLCRL